jgi:hypothetical protein
MLALAGLVSGCEPAPLLGDLTIYWDFLRHTYVAQPVSVPNCNANSCVYTCGEAGVDSVSITYPGGAPVASPPVIACTQLDTNGQPVPGITVAVPAGVNTYVVTGFRGGVPLFQGQGSANVVPGAFNRLDVLAEGLQGNLTVFALLGGVDYGTCGAGNIQQFGFILRDGLGTQVDAGTVPCAPTDGLGVAFGPVDLDDYTITLDAWELNPPNPANVIAFSACQALLAPPHFGNDSYTLNLPAGQCVNP